MWSSTAGDQAGAESRRERGKRWDRGHFPRSPTALCRSPHNAVSDRIMLPTTPPITPQFACLLSAVDDRRKLVPLPRGVAPRPGRVLRADTWSPCLHGIDSSRALKRVKIFTHLHFYNGGKEAEKRARERDTKKERKVRFWLVFICILGDFEVRKLLVVL